jgi:hypothetical protein
MKKLNEARASRIGDKSRIQPSDFSHGYVESLKTKEDLQKAISKIENQLKVIGNATPGGKSTYGTRMLLQNRIKLLKDKMENLKENKMSKIIRLNENDIENLVVKILNEATPKKELERKETKYRKSSFEPYQRESELKTIFGPYGEDIPPQALEYMRKNPASVIKKLIKIYGSDKIKSYM